MNNNKTIGLVLSGGGMKGAAHLGVIKALGENNIFPSMISGSSVGAIVGALYAANFKAEEILEFFKINKTVFRWRHFSRSRPGFLNAERYDEIFESWLDHHTFETLSKKLFICVTDVLNGKFQFFSQGELVKPILASAAVPGVFSPVEIEDNWYIDGGTMNNFPVEALIGQCDFVIGSLASPNKPIPKSAISNSMRLINRATELTFHSSTLAKLHQCDHVFAPQDLYNYGIFDSKKIDEMFQVGYDHATQHMESLIQKLFEQQRQII
ncbi:MAG: patatin-like phospholipase family protein [Bacteroidota bacterium]